MVQIAVNVILDLSRDLCEIPLIIWKRHLENRTLHFDWLTVSYVATQSGEGAT